VDGQVGALGEVLAQQPSWARFAPGVKESAGRKKGTGSTGHGDRYLARVLGEAAVGASRTNTLLGERYRRIARRRGKKKAVVAVGRSILVIVWYLLQDDAVQFHDLGPGYYDSRINPERKKRNHIRELEALGYRVTLQPAAWPPSIDLTASTRPSSAGTLSQAPHHPSSS